MYNPRFLSEDQTIISVDIDADTVLILEKGISDEYDDVRGGSAGHIQPYVPEDDDGPEKPNPIVSRLQAKLALLQLGLLDDVEALINLMDRATQIAWNEAQQFKRSSPLLNGLVAAITWPDGSPLTDADVDQLFEIAQDIEV